MIERPFSREKGRLSYVQRHPNSASFYGEEAFSGAKETKKALDAAAKAITDKIATYLQPHGERNEKNKEALSAESASLYWA